MIAAVFGVIATVIFCISSLPMIVKVLRTRDLRSYSLGNLVLANIGNGAQAIYIAAGVPIGPLWVLHGFNTVVSLFMLSAWIGWRISQLESRREQGCHTRGFESSSPE